MTHVVDRMKARALSAEIDAAIAPVLAKHGMEKGKTHTTYGELYRFKIEATPIGAAKPEETDWQRFATLFNLPEDALGKEITLGGQKMKIVGLNTRARKMPVMLEAAGGKKYKAPAESVTRALLVAS